MWSKLMQHPALLQKNSPVVVNSCNNSAVVHDSSPSRHAAPSAIDLSGSVNADVAKYCAAIGVDPKAPISKPRSPPKATKAAMNPEDVYTVYRGSYLYLAYGNRNLFTGALF
jgi:hypothetical protein